MEEYLDVEQEYRLRRDDTVEELLWVLRCDLSGQMTGWWVVLP